MKSLYIKQSNLMSYLITPRVAMRLNALKQRCRSSLLEWTLKEIEHCDGSIDSGNPMLYSRDSLPWLKRSWVDVPTSVFVHCFRRAHILP
jgi:hypothetical protein